MAGAEVSHLHQMLLWCMGRSSGLGRLEARGVDGPSSSRRAQLAVQGQRQPSPAHSEAAVPGHQLGGVRCGPARTWQSDGVVHGGGGLGLEGLIPDRMGRTAAVFGAGHLHGLDASSRLPPALRQTESLIGSIIALLGLDLAVPDHSTLSHRADIPRARPGTRPIHLLVDSTGLRLCGPGEWLVGKRGSRARRSWRKLHIGVDADTGQIVAAELTSSDVDDASQVGPLLDQVTDPIASFTADGAYDQDGVYCEVAARHPDAGVIVPPRFSAVPSATAETAPTKRDQHLRAIAESGRMSWQKASGYDCGVPWSRRISRASSGGSAVDCARVPTGAA